MDFFKASRAIHLDVCGSNKKNRQCGVAGVLARQLQSWLNSVEFNDISILLSSVTIVSISCLSLASRRQASYTPLWLFQAIISQRIMSVYLCTGHRLCRRPSSQSYFFLLTYLTFSFWIALLFIYLVSSQMVLSHRRRRFLLVAPPFQLEHRGVKAGQEPPTRLRFGG